MFAFDEKNSSHERLITTIWFLQFTWTIVKIKTAKAVFAKRRQFALGCCLPAGVVFWRGQYYWQYSFSVSRWSEMICFVFDTFLCIYKLIRISIIDWAEWVKLTMHFCPSSASRKAKIRSNFLINLKTFWWMSIILNNLWKSSTDAFSIIGMKVLHI